MHPYYSLQKRSVISAQTSTAVSRRLRDESNAYNILNISGNEIKIEIRILDMNKFRKSILPSIFLKIKNGLSKGGK